MQGKQWFPLLKLAGKAGRTEEPWKRTWAMGWGLENSLQCDGGLYLVVSDNTEVEVGKNLIQELT